MCVINGEILYKTQCVNIPPGASGSSRKRTRLFASCGTPDTVMGGVYPSPSHVYFAAIVP